VQPTRLSVRDFGSYRVGDIDLCDLQMAALVGPNGSGKSTLLDILTYALFGEGSKGGQKELDNYVRNGAEECRADVEFVLGDDTYRVVRTRSLKGAGKSQLEFYVLGPQGWLPLGGKTIRDTQAEIERVLRMDYRTFTASALVLQGKSDSLTADMTDAERKTVFARILGLDIYERLQTDAKSEAGRLSKDKAVAEHKLEPLLLTARRTDELQTRLTQLRQAKSAAGADVARLQERVNTLDARLRAKPELEQSLAQLRTDLAAKSQELEQIAAEGKRVRGDLDKHARVLYRLEDIELAVSESERLTKELEEIDTEAARLAGIDREIACLTQQIATRERAAQEARAKQEQRLAAAIAGLESRIDHGKAAVTVLSEVPCEPLHRQTCPLLAQAHSAESQLLSDELELERLGQEQAALAATETAELDTEAYGRLKSLREERDGASYSPAVHKAVRDKLASVRELAALAPRAEVARSEHARLVKEREELADKHRATSQQAQAIQARMDDVQAKLDAISPIAQELEQARTALRQQMAQAQQMAEDIGRLSRQLEECADG